MVGGTGGGWVGGGEGAGACWVKGRLITQNLMQSRGDAVVEGKSND